MAKSAPNPGRTGTNGVNPGHRREALGGLCAEDPRGPERERERERERDLLGNNVHDGGVQGTRERESFIRTNRHNGGTMFSFLIK